MEPQPPSLSDRAVLDCITEYALFTLDVEGRVTGWNEGARRIFGYESDQMLGREGKCLFVARDIRRGVPEEEMRSARETGRALDERWHVRSNGDRFWGSGLMFPVLGAGETLTGYVKVVRDRSAAKRIEDLREHDDLRMRLMLDRLPMLVAYLDREGRYAFNNVAYEAWFGIPLKELLGRPAAYMLGPDVEEALGANVRRALSGEPRELEVRAPARGGASRWVKISLIPDASPADEVRGVIALGVDITALKTLHERLESRAAGLEALVELAHDAIFVRDLAGVITFWNRGAEELYGWTAVEALGKVSHELLETRFPDGRDELERRLFESDRWEGELRHRTRDGGRLVVESRWALQRAPDGRPRAILEINRDVTKLKRTVDELRRSNKDLAEFAYFASHDLQEPLRAITTNAQLLERARPDDPEYRSWLARVGAAARRMRSLIKDLLAYNRAGEAEISGELVELAEALRLARETLAPALAQAGVVVEAGPLPAVRGSRDLLAAVFARLLSNAAKFRRPERPPTVRVQGTRAGSAWRISVSDDSIGVEARYLEEIFLPFKRLHRKDVYEGSGVGLAVSRRIIERHGGRIWAERNERGGLTVSFTLPAQEPRR